MNVTLSDDEISKVLQGIQLPPQPQILVDLQFALMMPDNLDKVVELISQDMCLAGIALKVANSDLVAEDATLSIRQAVQHLGVSNVLQIINGLSQKGAKGELKDETIVELTRFWDFAADTALVSKLIAEKIGLSDVDADAAYALGLFHNVGMPLMLLRFENYPQIMKSGYQGGNLVEVEAEQLSTNHETIGYYAAKSWNLPKWVSNIIANHHHIDEIFDHESDDLPKKLLAVVKLAAYICGEFSILGGLSENPKWQRIAQEVLDYVDLSTYEVAELEEAMREQGIETIGRFD